MAKILIAEDEQNVRMVLSDLIELKGHTAISSSNGRRAWETLKDNEDISMVITDVKMPEMDGRELIKMMREDSKFKKLPIIIISGVVGPKEISDVLSLGATAFLAKPVKTSDLHDYLARYLGQGD